LLFFVQEFPIVEQRHLFLITEGGMTLLDALRHAEQQGKESVHRGAEKMHNLEAAIRRRVRGSKATPDDPSARESALSTKVRTGIVSVNGRDVEEMRCTGGRRPA
jgi:hypothetical protein